MPDQANFLPSGHSGASLTHTDALPAGTKLAEFEIVGLLGVGGFGMVYSAYDSSLQRTVAIKEYMPSALAGRAGGNTVSCRSSADQDALNAGLRSFVAEARLLAQFDHPSLVKVYRFWEANNTAYMVMPLYRGMTLKEARYQMKAPPPESWLRAVLWSILGALKYLHEHNTVHRDISPDNIFLQDVGPPVLLDLGAARRAISDKSQKHTAILKVNYAPIEQYADAGDMAQGPWTDLYALAAVVHGCLCDAPPVPATFRAVKDRMPGFASIAKTVQEHYGQHYSPEFIQAFAHALEIHPDKRPQSVQAFMDEMKLVSPQGRLPVSWRDGLDFGGRGRAAADPMAMTEHQTKRITDISLPIDAPATDPAPLGHISAYGLLEQESPLLVVEEVPEIAMTAPAAPTMVVNSSQPVNADNSFRKLGPTRNEAVAPVVPSAPVKSRKLLVAGLIGAVMVAGAVYWLPGGRSDTTASIAAPPQVTVNLPAAPVENKTEPAITGVTGVAEPAAAPVSAATASSTVVTPKAALPKRPVISSKPPEMQVGKQTDARPAVPHSTPAGAAAAKTEPEPAPTVPVTTAPKVYSGPVERCADRNFLARPMCIFQECEKPEFTHLAFCVENRRRLKENTQPFDRR